MSDWVQWLVAVAVVALPVVLMLAFHGDDLSDSRGRRLWRRWHASPSRIGRRGHQES